MTHLTPFRIVPRRRIGIREDYGEPRSRLKLWTVDLQRRAILGLGWLQNIPQCYWILALLLLIGRSDETFWYEVLDDSIYDISFLQSDFPCKGRLLTARQCCLRVSDSIKCSFSADNFLRIRRDRETSAEVCSCNEQRAEKRLRMHCWTLLQLVKKVISKLSYSMLSEENCRVLIPHTS